MIQFIRRLFGRVKPQLLTEQLIEELPPEKLFRKILVCELESDKGYEVFDAIMFATELHAEVFNGGFNQYYHNTDGERAETAQSTFVRLGADKVADLVKRANQQYASNRDHLQALWQEGKRGFLRSYKEKIFDAFDDEYYALMKNDKQLYEMIGTYIKQHPHEFVTGSTE